MYLRTPSSNPSSLVSAGSGRLRSFPPWIHLSLGRNQSQVQGHQPQLGEVAQPPHNTPSPPRRGSGPADWSQDREARADATLPAARSPPSSAGAAPVSAEPLGAPGLRPRGLGLCSPPPCLRPPPERVRPQRRLLRLPGPRPRAEAALQPPGSLRTPCGDGARRAAPPRPPTPGPAASPGPAAPAAADKPRDQPGAAGCSESLACGPLEPRVTVTLLQSSFLKSCGTVCTAHQ